MLLSVHGFLVSLESATMTPDYASYLLHTRWIEFVAMEDKLNEEATVICSITVKYHLYGAGSSKDERLRPTPNGI